MVSTASVALLAACCFLCSPARALLHSQRNVLDTEVLRDAGAGPQSATGDHNLVFMHIPYNFGHTIEKVALFPSSVGYQEFGGFLISIGLGGASRKQEHHVEKEMEDLIAREAKPDGIPWGHINPELQQINNVTGCSMFFSPQKYWPKDLSAKYFGDKKVFGMLRNPHERLVAMVRGAKAMKDFKSHYGNDFDQKYLDTCDLNSAIKQMLKKHIQRGDQFSSSCAYIPQAEYFDGPYGITVPVDNMKFPGSFNDAMMKHGYEDIHIRTEDIYHVSGCPQNWSADLDSETKSLIKHVYARDFELICKYFGQCDDMKDDCIHGVPLMCPESQCHGAEPCPAEPYAFMNK